MTDRPRVWGRALGIGVLAAGCLLLGACKKSPKTTTEAIAELRVNVQKTVKDPARAAQAMVALDSVTVLVPTVSDFETRTSNELRTLLRDYGATRADFDSVIARWDADRAQVRGRVLSAHEAFKQALTDAEWKKLQDEERKILLEHPVVHDEGAGQAPEGGR